jgi:hypothetical protein
MKPIRRTKNKVRKERIKKLEIHIFYQLFNEFISLEEVFMNR